MKSLEDHSQFVHSQTNTSASPTQEALVEHGRSQRDAARELLTRETGWEWEPSELAHFRTRPKSFSSDAKKWRKMVVSGASRGDFGPLFDTTKHSATEIRSRLDESIGILREIMRILRILHGTGLEAAPAQQSCDNDSSFAYQDVSRAPAPDALSVLVRLNPFATIGITPVNSDTPGLWDLVPPLMRDRLQILLQRHAQHTCNLPTPKCNSCELARFCETYRLSRASEAAASQAAVFIDLFCGAGGISLGFSRAGFRPVLAIDSDEAACTTYRMNHPEIASADVVCADIRETSTEEMLARVGDHQLDVLIAAPPCQGFSLAGFRSKQSLAASRTIKGYSIAEDERNYFFEYFVNAAVSIRPKLVLMENVPGMDSPRPGGAPSFMRVAEQMLREAGFLTAVWKLDAAGYGVPQRRVRTFLIGSSIGRLPAMPEPEFQHSASRRIDPDALPPLTTESAIFDLPAVDADGGAIIMAGDGAVPPSDPRWRYYLRNKRFPISTGSKIIFNHKCRYHNPRDLELYSLLRPGEDSIHVVERHGRSDLMRYRRDVFDDKYARLRPDQPSKTIVSHLAKDGNSYIHPTQNRSITPREAARLQSFPDDFVFCGAPSEQWIQIGNSVPPALAAVIARSFHELLEREKSK